MRETVYPGCLHVGEWLNGVWRKPKLRNAKPTKESMWCWNCSRDRKQSKEGKPLYTPGRLARSSKCTKSTLHHLNLQGHKIDKQKKRKKKKGTTTAGPVKASWPSHRSTSWCLHFGIWWPTESHATLASHHSCPTLIWPSTSLGHLEATVASSCTTLLNTLKLFLPCSTVWLTSTRTRYQSVNSWSLWVLEGLPERSRTEQGQPSPLLKGMKVQCMSVCNLSAQIIRGSAKQTATKKHRLCLLV